MGLEVTEHIDETKVNFDKQIAILTGNETAMGIIETIKMIPLEEGIEKVGMRSKLRL